MFYCKKYTCNSQQDKTIHATTQGAAAQLELCKNIGTTSGVLYGRVVNPFGQPVPYAIVKLVSQAYEPIRIAKTDRLGRYFVFHVPANQPSKVMAAAENYSLNDEIEICFKEGEVLELDILLCHRDCIKDGIVTGTVSSKVTSLPLARAQVVLYEESGGHEHFKRITDTNEMGQFALTGLSLGAYRVEICLHGYIHEQHRVHITKCGQIVDRVVSLCPSPHAWKGTVSGVITDPSHMPIANADVILYSVASSGKATPIAYTKTNQNGVYLFINIDVGTYRVSAK